MAVSYVNQTQKSFKNSLKIHEENTNKNQYQDGKLEHVMDRKTGSHVRHKNSDLRMLSKNFMVS